MVYWRTNIPCKILQERNGGYVIIQYGENSITTCHISDLMNMN